MKKIKLIYVCETWELWIIQTNHPTVRLLIENTKTGFSDLPIIHDNYWNDTVTYDRPERIPKTVKTYIRNCATSILWDLNVTKRAVLNLSNKNL